MRLVPFVSVDDTPFTATPDDIRRQFGQPHEEGFNFVGLTEFDYGSVVFRFQSSGRLEEVTIRAEEIQLPGQTVARVDLPAYLRAHDADAFERAGFLVSPLLGLAFVPGDAPWVTALAAHCLGEWRALAP